MWLTKYITWIIVANPSWNLRYAVHVYMHYTVCMCTCMYAIYTYSIVLQFMYTYSVCVCISLLRCNSSNFVHTWHQKHWYFTKSLSACQMTAISYCVHSFSYKNTIGFCLGAVTPFVNNSIVWTCSIFSQMHALQNTINVERFAGLNFQSF